MKPRIVLCLALLVSASSSTAAPSPPAAQGRVLDAIPAILPVEERIEPVNEILATRLDDLLPRLMREAGIDLWLVISREYNEDPVYFTLAPEPSFAARRTTILLFHDRGPDEGLERLTVSRYPLGELYEPAWEGGDLDEQWTRLAELVRERNPRRIGIDVSRDWPVADGLSAGLDARLREALGPELSGRLVSAEDLVIRWIETRTERELAVWPQIVGIARAVIAEAFSSRTITPGVTTPREVAWRIRQRFEDLDLPVWFNPYVNVQRPGFDCEEGSPFCSREDVTIQPGDVLHTDVGICYLRLCTDTQEMGYVARLGEEGPPPGLVEALAVGNRWQDLLTDAFATGRTGNQILAAALEAAASEGVVSSVYTHPLGHFGHAPGPTIGMWDNQGPTAVRGDWPLHPDTGYAIEGNVKVRVPEWDGQWVQIKLEQSAVWDGERVLYLAGRQTEWHVVR